MKKATLGFLTAILLSSCGAQPASPTAAPATLTPAAVSTAVYTPGQTDTAAPSVFPTNTPTFTPTLAPESAVIGLENFSRLAILHEYAPDINAVIHENLGEYGFANDPVFSPDGRRIALTLALADDSRELIILDAPTGDLILPLALPEGVKHVPGTAFSPDGAKLIVSTSPSEKITLYDLASGKPERVLWAHTGLYATNLAFRPDGKQITAVVFDPANNGRGAQLYVWDAESGDLLQRLPADAQYGVNISRFSADGSRLVQSSLSAGKQLTVYDTATWKSVSLIRPAVGSAELAAISPDGKYVLTGRQGAGDILLWDAGAGKQVSSLPNEFGGLTAIVFGPDGSYFIAAGGPKEHVPMDEAYISARIWDTATWSVAGNQYWIHTDALYVSPDGKSFLGRSNYSLFLIGLADTGILAAEKVLHDFTVALGRGDYTAAAALFYIGDLELGNLKKQDSPTDTVTILKTLCERKAFPCLPAEVAGATRYSGETRAAPVNYGFIVRYLQADGSAFAGAKGATLFDIFVGLDPDGNFKVVDLMIDLAAALK